MPETLPASLLASESVWPAAHVEPVAPVISQPAPSPPPDSQSPAALPSFLEL